ncbi:MAG: leucine-rich repeat domain-containing protein [Spirochaetes bacterium]|nr:leucine-rich repeat domain-containing protein [Spirochaetota bacterium]
MKKSKNIGLLTAAALAGLVAMACNWYSAEFVHPPLYEIDGNFTFIPETGVITGLSPVGLAAVAGGMTTLNIPSTIGEDNVPVTGIENYAFFFSEDENDPGLLTGVTLPNGITFIGDYAFANNRLQSPLTIPNSVQQIGEGAFARNQLTSINLPTNNPNFTVIADVSFAFNNLNSISIPSSVTSIGEGAFDSNSLSSVSIPATVNSIGDNAFYENDLNEVIFHGSPTIGDFAFGDLDTEDIIYVLEDESDRPITFFRDGNTWDWN